MRRLANIVLAGLIVLLAVGLALTAVQRVREAAAISACHNNMRALALGLDQYHHVYSRFPFATLPNPSLPPERRLSWLFELDPFIHARMDPDWTAYGKESCDSERNLKIARQRFPWVICPISPTSETTEGYTLTTYVGTTGIGRDAAALPDDDPRAGFFGYERKLAIGDFRSGLGTTFAVLETANDNGPWMAGGWPTARGFDSSVKPAIGSGGQFGGFHRNGANVLMADGSVRFVNDTADPVLLTAQFTVVREETRID